WPSVVSPRSRPSPPTSTVFTEPALAAASDSSSQIRAAAPLWGMVTLTPANPSAATPRSAGSSRSGATGIATYAQSMPSSANAALCITGDREWSTGQPITPERRVAPPIGRSAAMREEVVVVVREVVRAVALGDVVQVVD